MVVTKNIFLPLDAEGPFEHIKTQQCCADSLQVKVQLLVKNQPVTIPGGITPQVVYQKPDGHLVVNDCRLEDSYIIVDYTEQMLIAAGTAKAQIHYSENNQEIYSSAWYTDIYPTVGGVLEESSDQYNTISNFVNKAASSATAASSSAEQAAGSASNAEYYYTQTKSISESISGALKPMGTVEFSKLPSLEQASEGDMYNVSDQFTTTSEFKEGEGRVVPAGSNIYKTFDGYWDVLAGSPVTGVKGSSETAYRTGNVDITPENIGLGNVDNTSDADKPISTAAQDAFNELNSNFNDANTAINTLENKWKYAGIINKSTQNIETVSNGTYLITVSGGNGNSLVYLAWVYANNTYVQLISGTPYDGSYYVSASGKTITIHSTTLVSICTVFQL